MIPRLLGSVPEGFCCATSWVGRGAEVPIGEVLEEKNKELKKRKMTYRMIDQGWNKLRRLKKGKLVEV